MNLASFIKIGILVLILHLAYSISQDPLRTALPFGTKDLSSVEGQLAKLSEGDRSLVESYVERTNGDVLPTQWADPDNPVTARTFEQAIELEKKWNEKMAVHKVNNEAFQVARQKNYQPLQKVVEAKILDTELTTVKGYKHPVLSIQIRVKNKSSRTIEFFEGSLYIREDAREYMKNTASCFLRIPQDFHPGEEVDITCTPPGELKRQRDYIDNKDSGRFTNLWEPSYIRFSGGSELKYIDPRRTTKH